MNNENSQYQDSQQDQNQGFRTMMSGLQFSSDEQPFQAASASVLDDILYAPSGPSTHNPFEFVGGSSFNENVDFSIGNGSAIVPAPLDSTFSPISNQLHSSALDSSSSQTNMAAPFSSNEQGEVSFPIPGEYLDNSSFGGGNSRRGQSISWIIRYGYAKIIDGSYHCNIDRANCKESYSSSATTSILRHAKRKHHMDGVIG